MTQHTTDSTAPCLYEVKDRIATLTLNRLERMNGWTGDMHAPTSATSTRRRTTMTSA